MLPFVDVSSEIPWPSPKVNLSLTNKWLEKHRAEKSMEKPVKSQEKCLWLSKFSLLAAAEGTGYWKNVNIPPRNVELAGVRAGMQGLWRMFYSATRACHANGASKPLCRLRGAQGELRVFPHVPVTAPCLGKGTVPLLCPAPGCEQRLQRKPCSQRSRPGRERQGRQEIRGKAPAVLALIAAAPLG